MELLNTRSVNVIDEVEPVFAYEPYGENDVRRVEVGRIVRGTYQENHDNFRDMRQYVFVPKDGKAKPVKLGSTGEGWKHFDHTHALEPVLDQWQLEKTQLYKGGADAIHVLKPRVMPRVWDDPVQYDRSESVWEKRIFQFNELDEIMVVQTSIRPNNGINYEVGFFRHLCTNLLASPIFRLPGLRLTHRNWNILRIQEWVNDARIGKEFPDDLGGMRFGPRIGTTDGIRRYTSFLRDLSNGELAPEREAILNPVIKGLNLMNKGYATDVVTEFDRMAAWADDNGYGYIDSGTMMNALTNPIGLAETRVYNKTGNGVRGYERMSQFVPTFVETSALLIALFSSN